MAHIHLNSSSNGGRVNLHDPTTPKYVGARAEVTRTEEGVRIWLKDYQGETEEVIAEAIESITTNADGSLTFTLPDERTITTNSLRGPQGVPGEQGPPGDPGETGDPGEEGVGIASITKTGTSGLVDTYTITYTDGTTSTFTVTNGQDGTDGQDGDDGADGFSPTATVVKVGDTATITITDKNGTTTASISEFSGSYDDLTDKPTIPAKNIWYGTCSSSADSGLKEITTSSGDFVLAIGNMVRTHFTYGADVSTPVTISVDGCTAKSVSNVGGILEQGLWGSTDALDFVYNGASWEIVLGHPATTSKYGITKLSNSLNSSDDGVAATSKAIKEVMDVVATKSTVTATAYMPQGEMTKIMDLGIGGNSMSIYAPDYIYWATYGTTTAAQIEAELNAGHLVCLRIDSKVYALSYQYKVSNTAVYDFYTFDSDGRTIYRKRCTSNNGWSDLGTIVFPLYSDINDVYYAEYNDDTYSNVRAAYNAGKKVVAFYADGVQSEYIDLIWFNSEEEIFFFSKVSEYTEIQATLNAQDVWTSTTKLYASASSNISSFTNDAGYLTLSTLPIYNGGVS